MVTPHDPKGRRWRHLVSPDQHQLAGTVVAAMNRDFAAWSDANAVFDALQPRDQRLISTGASDLEAARLAAAQRVFEYRAIRTRVRLAWPIGPPDAISYTADGAVLFAVWRLFAGGGWRLIKRCIACAGWTVNAGDKPDKRFCSPECRTAWWNRQRDLRRGRPDRPIGRALRERHRKAAAQQKPTSTPGSTLAREGR